MRKSIFLLCLFLSGASLAEGPEPVYGIGGGLGVSVMSGDFAKTDSGPAVSMGFDHTGERFFFIGRGSASTAGDFAALEGVFGFGFKYLKIGTGAIGSRASIPTDEEDLVSNVPLLGGIVAVDTERDSKLDTWTVPLYVRFSPYMSRDTLLTLDAYLGLRSFGSRRIPVTVLGLPAEVETEASDVGGIFGAGVAFTKRIRGRLMLQVAYRFFGGKTEGGKTTLKGEDLGLFDVEGAPDTSWRNHFITVGITLGGI